MSAPVSLIVMTHDEALNLGHCLRSVAGLVEDAFVVDSGSTDRTVEIAREHGARVVEHGFRNQAQQFNWALDNLPIRTEWVLRLDGDEFLLPELRDEIETTLPDLPGRVTGLYMRRRVVFQNRWIRHGGYYPTWLMRLFRRGKARSELREMDEHLVLLEGESRRMKHDFVDWNRKGLAFWHEKHLEFAEREAAAIRRHERGERTLEGVPGRPLGTPPERTRWLKESLYLRCPLLLRAFLYFVHRYFVRLGFLDGRAGLTFHVLQGFWYRFYIDARLVEMREEAKRRGTADGSSHA